MDVWLAIAIGSTAAWIVHSFGWLVIAAAVIAGWLRKHWSIPIAAWGAERAISIPSILQWRSEIGRPIAVGDLLFQSLPALALCIGFFFVARSIRSARSR